MVEYVGIPYIEVMKHAFLPAIISYIALLYIVHLEALKANMVGLPRRGTASGGSRLLSLGLTVSGFFVLCGAVYWGVGWVKDVAGSAAIWIIGVALLAAYVGLLWFGSRQPELPLDDPNAQVFELPETGPTVKSGLHYLLAVVVASRSEANMANACMSRYCARLIFSVPDTDFMALTCAAPPTRETEMPTSIAGRWLALNRSDWRKICPSVIEITLVGM